MWMWFLSISYWALLSLRVMTWDKTWSDGVRSMTQALQYRVRRQREDHLLQVMLDHRAMMMPLAGGQKQTTWMGIQGSMEQDWAGPYKISYFTTQNNVQFKTYTLLIYGIFQLIFSYHGWLRITELQIRRDYCNEAIKTHAILLSIQ